MYCDDGATLPSACVKHDDGCLTNPAGAREEAGAWLCLADDAIAFVVVVLFNAGGFS